MKTHGLGFHTVLMILKKNEKNTLHAQTLRTQAKNGDEIEDPKPLRWNLVVLSMWELK